jgi:hypothetical protein
LRDAFLLGMGDERFFLAAADRDRSLRWRDPDRLRRGGDRDRLFRRRERDRDLVRWRRGCCCRDPDRPPPRFFDRERDFRRRGRSLDRDLESRFCRDRERDFFFLFRDRDREAFLWALSDFRLSLLEPDLEALRSVRSRLRLRDVAFFPFTFAGEDFLSPFFTLVSESLCFRPLARDRERDRDISFSNLQFKKNTTP